MELTVETLQALADQVVVLTTILALPEDQLLLAKETLAVIRQASLELEAVAVVLAQQAEPVYLMPLQQALEGLAFNLQSRDPLSIMLVAVVADIKLVTLLDPVLVEMAVAEQELVYLEPREFLARQILAGVAAEAGMLAQEALAGPVL